jgi:hypothetical protein
MSEQKMPRLKLKGRLLVRDKDGRPKFSNPSLIPQFIHALSEEDLAYLKEKYGDDFRT